MTTMSVIKATRYHDFSCGHRVVGHESKCAFLHGHNYRVHFDVVGDLDAVGRVLDFSVIKSNLCIWLESHWDHKFLAWEEDPLVRAIATTCAAKPDDALLILNSIVWVPFNPTAENMGLYLLNVVGPRMLQGSRVHLQRVVVEETRKCSAVVELR